MLLCLLRESGVYYVGHSVEYNQSSCQALPPLYYTTAASIIYFIASYS